MELRTLIFLLVFPAISLAGESILQAQSTQAIRGTVVDQNTGVPLIGATVLLLDHEPLTGTITDHQGFFSLEGVPVGRRSLRIDYMGYQSAFRQGLDINSANWLQKNARDEYL